MHLRNEALFFDILCQDLPQSENITVSTKAFGVSNSLHTKLRAKSLLGLKALGVVFAKLNQPRVGDVAGLGRSTVQASVLPRCCGVER